MTTQFGLILEHTDGGAHVIVHKLINGREFHKDVMARENLVSFLMGYCDGRQITMETIHHANTVASASRVSGDR